MKDPHPYTMDCQYEHEPGPPSLPQTIRFISASVCSSGGNLGFYRQDMLANVYHEVHQQ